MQENALYLLYSCFYLAHLQVIPLNALGKSLSTTGTKHFPTFYLHFTYKYQQCIVRSVYLLINNQSLVQINKIFKRFCRTIFLDLILHDPYSDFGCRLIHIIRLVWQIQLAGRRLGLVRIEKSLAKKTLTGLSLSRMLRTLHCK